MRKIDGNAAAVANTIDQTKGSKNVKEVESDEMTVEDLKKQLHSLQAEQSTLRKGMFCLCIDEKITMLFHNFLSIFHV
jgi:predicted transcriptional regulator